MKIHTCGDPKNPAVVLIHPMLFTGRQMIDLLGKKIPGPHYIIAPDQAGHGEDDGAYAPEADAAELRRFLLEKGITEVESLYGASMGGVISLRLLALGGVHYRTVRMEGIPLAKAEAVRGLKSALSLLFVRQKARKDPASMAKLLVPACGEEIARGMAEQMARMRLGNFCRIQRACLAGSAVPLEASVCDRMTFEWGEKEINCGQGKPLAGRLYPWAEVVVLPGQGHCTRLAKEPEKVAADLL